MDGIWLKQKAVIGNISIQRKLGELQLPDILMMTSLRVL